MDKQEQIKTMAFATQVERIATLYCGKCGEQFEQDNFQATDHNIAHTFADWAWDAGWEVHDGTILCGDCVPEAEDPNAEHERNYQRDIANSLGRYR